MPKEPDIVDRLAADIGNPRVVADVDKALERNAQERIDLLEFRKWAVRRHGEPAKVGSELPSTPLTVASLIAKYKTHEESGYQALRFKTRENYDSVLRRIETDLGPEELRDLVEGDRLAEIHKDWTERGTSMAHALIAMMRILATFGLTVLKDHDSRILRVTLHDMKVPKGTTSGVPLTAEQVVLIRMTAREMGYQSIALAQAIQFDTGLRQKDVIGEWAPMNEDGVSDITSEKYGKWLLGLRWNQIDDDLILSHITSMKGKRIEIDLRRKSMVMEELRSMYCELGELPTREKLPASGAVIIDEDTGRPYMTHTFRRRWRDLADKAGLPKDVKNMDTRAGSRPDVKKANQQRG